MQITINIAYCTLHNVHSLHRVVYSINILIYVQYTLWDDYAVLVSTLPLMVWKMNVIWFSRNWAYTFRCCETIRTSDFPTPPVLCQPKKNIKQTKLVLFIGFSLPNRHLQWLNIKDLFAYNAIICATQYCPTLSKLEAASCITFEFLHGFLVPFELNIKKKYAI